MLQDSPSAERGKRNGAGMDTDASAAGAVESVRVKKASTAFFIFMDAMRALVKQEMPGMRRARAASVNCRLANHPLHVPAACRAQNWANWLRDW